MNIDKTRSPLVNSEAMDTSYLSQQITTIIHQLHGLFDEIGVPSHERESRESELFSALSETLHNQLRLVSSEKNGMIEEARRLIKTIRQLEASLDGTAQPSEHDTGDAELKLFFPLLPCLQALKEKHSIVAKLHRERFEQVKKLVQALESYSSHLEPSFIKLRLPPTSSDAGISPTFELSPSYVNALDAEFTRVYEEYTKRVATVRSVANEIITLWAELGTPQAQTDAAIVKHARESPEQLGLHQDDLTKLRSRRDRLVEEKRGRERRLKELRVTIEGLWDRLNVEEQERKAFLAKNRGCGLRAINEFEDELSRLNELKRQNLHLFVEDARYKLQELWDGLYFSEEEMLEFTPAFSDVYSDALLSAHEAEIARLETLKEQRAPILQLIEKHRSLIKDRDDLAASSQDASRLMLRGQKGEKRDPTRLLREEKMRKRIAKDLPKVEAEVKQVLEDWEEEYGRPFLVHGERYLDELVASGVSAGPGRSKTPSGPSALGSKMTKSAPPAQKGGTVRGAPPPRSKTPTSLIARNPLASSVMSSSVISVSTAGRSSPCKNLARPPLGNLAHGSNSPERRCRPAAIPEDTSDDLNGHATLRKMGPPQVPPPKMKDFFAAPPVATPAMSASSWEEDSVRSASLVRQVAPEDVYDDRAPSQMSYFKSSVTRSESTTLQPYPPPIHSSSTAMYYQSSYTAVPRPRLYGHDDAPTAPPASRQISETSATSSRSVQTVTSGSENWESYDGGSEEEADVQSERTASGSCYSTMRAVKGKRVSMEFQGGGGKRVRAVEESVGGGQLVRVHHEGARVNEEAY